MSECKQCCKAVVQVPGKRTREFCPGDACRKAYSRANTGQSIADKPIPDTNTGQDGYAGVLLSNHSQVPTAEPVSAPGSWAPEMGVSKCYHETGIPLPGDPGYIGCCKLIDGRWSLDPNRKRSSKAESLTRYAHS